MEQNAEPSKFGLVLLDVWVVFNHSIGTQLQKHDLLRMSAEISGQPEIVAEFRQDSRPLTQHKK